MSPPIRLIHWSADEAPGRVAALRKAGYEVTWEPLSFPAISNLRHEPPALFLIDLTRRPASGRDAAIMLRGYRDLRHVPFVFIEGEPEKVAAIRELFPDALYTSWRGVRGAIETGLSMPPLDVVPLVTMADAYRNKPFFQKLGIRPGATVAILNAPDGFEETLGDLPEDVTLLDSMRVRPDMIIWFPRSHAEVEAGIVSMIDHLGRDGIWIAWPKKSSGIRTDVSMGWLHELCRGFGLANQKLCSFDTTWSGMKFGRRKK